MSSWSRIGLPPRSVLAGYTLTRRDAGRTALFEAFFAAAWFGWGQAAPPPWLRGWLGAGLVAALLMAVAGGVTSIRHRTQTVAVSDAVVGQRYGIVVGIEFGIAALGWVVLAVAGQPVFIPAFVCAVVGLHFFPLAPILHDPWLPMLGTLVTAVAVLAVVLHATADVAPSTVTGAGAGFLLSASALVKLLRRGRESLAAAAAG